MLLPLFLAGPFFADDAFFAPAFFAVPADFFTAPFLLAALFVLLAPFLVEDLDAVFFSPDLLVLFFALELGRLDEEEDEPRELAFWLEPEDLLVDPRLR